MLKYCFKIQISFGNYQRVDIQGSKLIAFQETNRVIQNTIRLGGPNVRARSVPERVYEALQLDKTRVEKIKFISRISVK